jgi:hypothetical protein
MELEVKGEEKILNREVHDVQKWEDNMSTSMHVFALIAFYFVLRTLPSDRPSKHTIFHQLVLRLSPERLMMAGLGRIMGCLQ